MKINPALEELKTSLLDQIQSLNTNPSENEKQALSQAKDLSFPGSKNEEWKYSPFTISKDSSFALRQGTGKSASSYSVDSFENCHLLVFVDGAFSEILSTKELPKGLEIQNIASPKTWIEGYENSIFSHLNDATAHLGGLEIRVAPKTVIEKPVVLLHILTPSDSGSWCQPRVQIQVGERAEVSFAEIWESGNPEATVVNALSEITVDKSAFVKWLNFEKGTASLSLINQTRVETAEKAVFQHVAVCLGEGYLRNNLEIRIQGEYGDAHMYGLSLGNKKLHVDHHTFVRHMPENTTSNQLYKGIFSGKSTGVFNGKILVDQPAQKTNAYQSSKNILISTDAKVFAKPQLEIFADDVKCSHGATIGQLDEEPIFYLRSRGLDLATARMLLVQAFASEILMKIEHPDLRNLVEKEVLSEMDRMITPS
jgi:Fe-S cluster assembly protein SufD